MNDEQMLRYSRHILLNHFDYEGQQRLLDASVLIIGAGGLGCPAAMYLASAGVGRILLCDDDCVEVSNLQRQIGHATTAIGEDKVTSLAATLKSLNPEVVVQCYRQRFDEALAEALVPSVDLVLDCSDNFTTRFMVNRVCWQSAKPLVSAAAVRAEGQIVVFNPADASSPCYRCLYSEDAEVGAGNCSENGVLAPLVGVFGSMQAAEAIKLLSGYGKTQPGKLLVGDLFTGDWRSLRLGKDPDCPVCSAC